MLRERVVALHGDMVVDSSSSGARVEIRVPLPRAV
jgi:signal transduction histidine kinase